MSETIMLRNSERGSFKTCRQRWEWSYVEGLQAAEAPYALRFGDLVHRALAAYYKKGLRRGPKPAETFETLYQAQVAEKDDAGFDVHTDEKWMDALELGVGMLEAYREEYHERDKQYRVLSSEQTFQWPIKVVVPFTNPLRRVRVLVVGTFDGVWQDRSSLELLFPEHKTATAIKEPNPMDDQASTYWTYGPAWLRKKGWLKEGEEIKYILYNFLRKAIRNPDDRYDAAGLKLNLPTKAEKAEHGEDYPGSPSKSQPARFFNRFPSYRDEFERRLTHDRIKAEAGEIILAREGLLSVYKNPGPLHMPNCQGCFAKEFCEVHEVGSDWKAVRNAVTVAWDPYAEHELAERN